MVNDMTVHYCVDTTRFLLVSTWQASSGNGTCQQLHPFATMVYIMIMVHTTSVHSKTPIPSVTTLHCDYMVTTTVTMKSLLPNPWCSDYWTVAASHTPGTGYSLPWGQCRNLATRHLVDNNTVTTWATTRYPITHSHRVGIKVTQIHGFVAFH